MVDIIVNPAAGHGRAISIGDAAERYCKQHQEAYRLHHTQRPGHATELAQHAVSTGAQSVIGVGGDGTMLEIARALVGTSIPLGILPGGTGNDVAKTLHLPTEPEKAMETMLKGYTKSLDIGEINGEIFLNVVGTGFDVEVLDWSLLFKKRMHGMLPYLLGIIMTIVKHQNVHLQITSNGKTVKQELLLFTVTNGKTFGGGMRVSPNADMSDGHFDLCCIGKVPKIYIPFLLPKFLSGKHVDLSYVNTSLVQEVLIEGKGLRMDIDGEIVPMDRAHVKISSKKLLVLAPDEAQCV